MLLGVAYLSVHNSSQVKRLQGWKMFNDLYRIGGQANYLIPRVSCSLFPLHLHECLCIQLLFITFRLTNKDSFCFGKLQIIRSNIRDLVRLIIGWSNFVRRHVADCHKNFLLIGQNKLKLEICFLYSFLANPQHLPLINP